MKIVQLFHNPGAGDGTHTPETLIDLIEKAGYKCHYVSTKEKGWKNAIQRDADIMAVAGGDGTIRKVAKELLKKTLLDGVCPIAILPMGTANNISKSLNISAPADELVAGWENSGYTPYDIGKITGMDEPLFFLESFGFGIFPNHMKDMKKQDTDDMSPEKKLQLAVKQMKKVAEEYAPRTCQLTIDGTDHSGKYLMVEVMNIKSIGPNLELNPNGRTGDGDLDVVLIGEEQRAKLVSYICDKANGAPTQGFRTLKAKKIEMTWEGLHAHTDDETIKKERSTTIKIEILPGVLNVLTPTVPK